MHFTNVVKPTHLCNLDCSYCYNEDARKPIMTSVQLERVVRETLFFANEQDPGASVDFIWHGGEPTIAGIAFFQRAIEVQAEVGLGLHIENTLQTNGTLINEEWAQFLSHNRFRVSISIDGPEHLNDLTRKDRAGKSSYKKIIKAMQFLRNAKVPFGVCVVLSRANRDHAEEIYDFLSREKLPFNVIPLTRSGAGYSNYSDVGLEDDEYAGPWISMFDRWFDAPEENYVYASDFVYKTRAILNGKPADCIGQVQCSKFHFSTDPEGNVYPCATLSADKNWLYGNLFEQSLSALMASDVAIRAQSRSIDPHCVTCKWQSVCNGGCMSRAIKFFGTHDTRDYYCPSLYRIYEHIELRLRREGSLDLHALPSEGTRDSRHAPPRRALKEKQLVQIQQA
jgi:uncharacterized protein